MSPALADRFFTTSAMLSEINQTQKDKFHLQMLPKIVKFRERESQIVTARAWGKEEREEVAAHWC